MRTWELPNDVLDGAEVTAFASRRSAGALQAAARSRCGRCRRWATCAARSGRAWAARSRSRAGSDRVPARGWRSALDGYDIAHALELRTPLTRQAVEAREQGRVKRVVATVMENIPFRPPENRSVAQRMAASAREVDHFQAIDRARAAHLHTVGVPDERITALPARRRHGALRARRRPRARTGRSACSRSSRLEPAKGVEDLVIAAGLLARRGVEMELTLIGDGPLKARLEVDRGASWGSPTASVCPAACRGASCTRSTARTTRSCSRSAATRNWREQFGFAPDRGDGRAGCRCWSATPGR